MVNLTNLKEASTATVLASLCVHESSNPLPDLIVTWYATSVSLIPNNILDDQNWEELRKNSWEEIKPNRIGSAITRNDGTARLEYSYGRLKTGKNTIARLWYTVELPEVAGTLASGRIVHVASQALANPTEQEIFSVRFPRDVITRFGIGNNITPTIDSKGILKDIREQLMNVKKGVRRVVTEHVITPVFADQYNQKILEAKHKLINEHAYVNDSRSFAIPLEVKNIDPTISSKLKVGFNEAKIILVVNSGEGEKALKFDGVVRFTNNALTKNNFKKIHFLVNEKNGNINLALPNVPDVLELADETPSLLFRRSIKYRQ